MPFYIINIWICRQPKNCNIASLRLVKKDPFLIGIGKWKRYLLYPYEDFETKIKSPVNGPHFIEPEGYEKVQKKLIMTQ